LRLREEMQQVPCVYLCVCVCVCVCACVHGAGGAPRQAQVTHKPTHTHTHTHTQKHEMQLASKLRMLDALSRQKDEAMAEVCSKETGADK